MARFVGYVGSNNLCTVGALDQLGVTSISITAEETIGWGKRASVEQEQAKEV